MRAGDGAAAAFAMSVLVKQSGLGEEAAEGRGLRICFGGGASLRKCRPFGWLLPLLQLLLLAARVVSSS